MSRNAPSPSKSYVAEASPVRLVHAHDKTPRPNIAPGSHESNPLPPEAHVPKAPANHAATHLRQRQKTHPIRRVNDDRPLRVAACVSAKLHTRAVAPIGDKRLPYINRPFVDAREFCTLTYHHPVCLLNHPKRVVRHDESAVIPIQVFLRQQVPKYRRLANPFPNEKGARANHVARRLTVTIIRQLNRRNKNEPTRPKTKLRRETIRTSVPVLIEQIGQHEVDPGLPVPGGNSPSHSKNGSTLFRSRWSPSWFENQEGWDGRAWGVRPPSVPRNFPPKTSETSNRTLCASIQIPTVLPQFPYICTQIEPDVDSVILQCVLKYGDPLRHARVGSDVPKLIPYLGISDFYHSVGDHDRIKITPNTSITPTVTLAQSCKPSVKIAIAHKSTPKHTNKTYNFGSSPIIVNGSVNCCF